MSTDHAVQEAMLAIREARRDGWGDVILPGIYSPDQFNPRAVDLEVAEAVVALTLVLEIPTTFSCQGMHDQTLKWSQPPDVLKLAAGATYETSGYLTLAPGSEFPPALVEAACAAGLYVTERIRQDRKHGWGIHTSRSNGQALPRNASAWPEGGRERNAVFLRVLSTWASSQLPSLASPGP